MFSKPCQYAVRATLYLGLKADDGQKYGVKHVSESLDIPKHYLAKILQQLTKHKLISSTKGPHGGFFLTEENMNAHILDIIECIDGDHAMSECILGLPKCSSKNPCPLHNETVTWRANIIKTLGVKSIRQAVFDLSTKGYKI